jgi:hypothetical protein
MSDRKWYRVYVMLGHQPRGSLEIAVYFWAKDVFEVRKRCRRLGGTHKYRKNFDVTPLSTEDSRKLEEMIEKEDGFFLRKAKRGYYSTYQAYRDW